MDRNLDGVYFRTNRNGEWVNVCFSDLENWERDLVTESFTVESWKRLAYHLGDVLKEVGDEFNVVRVN